MPRFINYMLQHIKKHFPKCDQSLCDAKTYLEFMNVFTGINSYIFTCLSIVLSSISAINVALIVIILTNKIIDFYFIIGLILFLSSLIFYPFIILDLIKLKYSYLRNIIPIQSNNIVTLFENKITHIVVSALILYILMLISLIIFLKAIAVDN